MKYAAILLAFSFCAFGAPRIEVSKVIKADTVKTITYDTLTVTKTYKDTTVLVKVDTATTKKAITKIFKDTTVLTKVDTVAKAKKVK